MREEDFWNRDLLNAYVVLHYLKCGEIEKANSKLNHGKYFDILIKVIFSCREGASIEAAHSELTVQIEEASDALEKISSVDNDGGSSGDNTLIRNSAHDGEMDQGIDSQVSY